MSDAETGNDFWEAYLDEASGYQVVVEDDGRVAYAYLLDPAHGMVADVWLYNRCASPSEPEWTNPQGAPFANPAEYVKADSAAMLIGRAADVSIEWTQGARTEARIYIRNSLAGVLVPGSRPGWSAMAAQDGPLAKAL